MDDFLQFVNKTPTPYHFVQYAREILLNNGFQELNDSEPLPEIFPDKGFIVRKERTLICFSFGSEESIVGFCAHSDSACLKLKYNYSKSQFNTNLPRRKSTRKEEEICKSKYPEMLRLSMYGSGLWHTYLDRDLRVAGSVVYTDKQNINEVNENLIDEIKDDNFGNLPIVKTRDVKIDLEDLNESDLKEVKFKLVDSETGIAVIPNLSMHLAAYQAFAPNFHPELHFNAMFGSFPSQTKTMGLKSYIASLISTDESQIIDWDLRFVDANPAISMGDLIFGGRLDDLSSCYAGLKALIEPRNKKSYPTQIFAVFDHAEANHRGVFNAKSEFLNSIIECIYKKYYFLKSSQNQLPNSENYAKVDFLSPSYLSYCLNIKNRSVLLSCNNDYGMNPNYHVMTNESIQSQLGKGPFVRATNSSQISNDIIGRSITEDAASTLYQTLQIRIIPSRGSEQATFGPFLMERTGIRTIDIGLPILALHSIREVMNFNDLQLLMRLISCLFSNNCLLEFYCNDYK